MESKGKFFYKTNPQDLTKYEQNSVYFSKPLLVDYFESNYGKIVHAKRIQSITELKSLKYPIDLNSGYESFVAQSPSYTPSLDCLKYAMSSAAEKDACISVDNIEKTKVYTRRGTLVSLMETIYKKKFIEWAIRVSHYKGNIYMVQDKCNEYSGPLKPFNTHHNRLEKILFADSPNGLPKAHEACNANIALCAVHRSNLGEYDVIYSGEVQGIISDEEITDFDDTSTLNDCRFVLAKQMWTTLKYKDGKWLNYWLQSYLAGVKDIYLAYKNSNGVIEEPIEHKIVSTLPKNRKWKPGVCTTFVYDFLQKVKMLMTNVNCLNTVYMFHYNPEEKSIYYEIYEGKTDKSFISDEYIKYCKEMST